MGTQNRQRRAAKQKQRANAGGRRAAGPRPSPDEAVRQIRRLFEEAVAEAAVGDRHLRFERFVDALEESLAPLGLDSFPTMIANAVAEDLHETWHRGWQPADVVGVVRRRTGPAVVELAMLAILDEADHLDPQRVAPERWAAQVDTIRDALGTADLADPGPVGTDASGRSALIRALTGPAAGNGQARRASLKAGLVLIAWLRRLPRLPQLLPEPCAWPMFGSPGAGRPGTAAAPGHLDPSMLAKVRGLLAKAESTTFEAEAMAFTAKAQQLMARHAIDRAVLDHDEGDLDRPEGIRVHIEDPYAAERSMLLAVVADANRTRAVYSKDLGFSTVFGFAGDLDAVELLYTSLLVQATTAMHAHGSQRDRGGRSTTRSFRQSFLVGFANRIGERLRQAAGDAIAEAAAERGTSVELVPILAERDHKVDEAMDTAFPQVTNKGLRVNNRHGWVAGQVAAEAASLSVGEPLAP